MSVAAIAETVWQQRIDRSPLTRLRLGLPVTTLPSGSLAEAADAAHSAAEQLAALDALGAVDDADWLTAAFLRALLRSDAEEPSRWWWHFPVTPYQLYNLSVVAPQALAGAADRDGVIAGFTEAVDTAAAKLRAMAERGWLVPAPALDGVRATIAALSSGPFGGEDAPAAALRALRAIVEELAPNAPNAVGLSQYDGGAEAYRELVRVHATFDISPEEVHLLGLREVLSLTARMAELQARLGVDGDEAAMREHLRQIGVLHAASADDVEARYRAAIARIEPVMESAFHTLPTTPYGIERLDASLEAAMSYGYYEFPTIDAPIGRYRYNGSGLETRSQLNAAALIYHELIPGHHFHVARQGENESLPTIRREATTGIGQLTAYAEGWAEYAAHVAGELGMYADPYDEYGRLSHERFMASRLVLDTGMNAFGWSLDEARVFMRANSHESDTQVATDTLRYSTDLPGQAIAYRLGDLKLRELRAQAGIDWRDFHELVLRPGALQLDVLTEHITRETSH